MAVLLGPLLLNSVTSHDSRPKSTSWTAVQQDVPEDLTLEYQSMHLLFLPSVWRRLPCLHGLLVRALKDDSSRYSSTADWLKAKDRAIVGARIIASRHKKDTRCGFVYNIHYVIYSPFRGLSTRLSNCHLFVPVHVPPMIPNVRFRLWFVSSNSSCGINIAVTLCFYSFISS